MQIPKILEGDQLIGNEIASIGKAVSAPAYAH